MLEEEDDPNDTDVKIESDYSIRLKQFTNPRKVLEQTDVRHSQSSIKVIEDSTAVLTFTLPLKLNRWFTRYYYRYHIILKVIWFVFLIVLFNIYMKYAIKSNWGNTQEECEGIRVLTYSSLVCLISLFYFLGFKPLFGSKVNQLLSIVSAKLKSLCPCLRNPIFSIICGSSICVVITLVVLAISQDSKYRLISFIGILVLIGLGYLFSKQRQLVDWKLVIWGLAVQFSIAIVLLRWQVGRLIMECISSKVSLYIMYTDYGSEKIFGYLVTGNIEFKNKNEISTQFFILGFKIFTIVIFFALSAAVLFYYGVLQWIIVKLGWLLQMIIGTTAVESMTAAANVFLGMTEAPLTVKPYLKKLTLAELHSVMTSGFATIAGTVLVAYIAMGINGTHLLTASLMSSPAALIYSKLVYPEAEISLTTPLDIAKMHRRTGEQNVIEAAVHGIYDGLLLFANIIANLISFISLIKIIDTFLESLALLIGVRGFNSQLILAYCFIPIAFLMGVDWNECTYVAELIGIRTVINEFVAYLRLIELKDQSKLSYRSQMIATYALCGFSNVGSIGIMIGGFGSLVPERLSDITALALRAMIAGSCASFLTACVAGTVMEDYSEGMVL